MPRKNRRKSRSIALQILYFLDVAELDAEKGIARFWQSFSQDGADREFVNELVVGVVCHKERVDGLLASCSEHWRLERMPLVDRNLLRLACYELLEQPDVPLRVVLNEAVELAKLFGSEHSAAFVNGVLDQVAQSLDKE